MKKIITLFLILLSFNSFGASKNLLLATTTSVRDSGLLEYILPDFKKETGINIKFISVGTGQALRMGEDGEVDALLVHNEKSELKFMKEKNGIERIQFMHNFFVIVGPKDGNKFTNMDDILNEIDKKNYKFISRDDDSGTNKKELSLWKEYGITPSKDWYISSGSGMAVTLKIASEKGYYTLTDMSSYLHLKDKLNLEIKLDANKDLMNKYSIITINPNKNKFIHYDNAKLFMKWITSKKTKEIISTYGVKEFGVPLFITD